MRVIRLGAGVLPAVLPARTLGAYTLDMKMKTYPMFPVGAGSLWTVWPYKSQVRDGEGVYPDDGVWNREAGTHQGRY